jgi:hypothetical protein
VRRPFGGHALAQNAADLFWFLAARVYHETTLLNDPCMRQFIDVLALLATLGDTIDWGRVEYMANRYSLHPSIFYVGTHANELLGQVVPPVLLSRCAPTRRSVSRAHDWGDLMPKLLRRTAVLRLPAHLRRAAGGPRQLKGRAQT